MLENIFLMSLDNIAENEKKNISKHAFDLLYAPKYIKHITKSFDTLLTYENYPKYIHT